jgi:hypothetical protein
MAQAGRPYRNAGRAKGPSVSQGVIEFYIKNRALAHVE